jgi:L,D-peptidoglycan transpeptidase YkuD (ErfK/YbiS/YcfS/YnhG family)
MHSLPRILRPVLSAILYTLPCLSSAQLSPAARQIIVTQTESWTSPTGQLQLFQRSSAAQPWQRVWEAAVPVNLGKKGLAWGRGVFTPVANGVPAKVEKDWRAPAGLFHLGRLYGYAGTPPSGARWPYLQVTALDAWVDDPANAYYNQHYRADPQAMPPWFEKQRMRLGDSAYKWMLGIQHNTSPPAPGYGSAIFFHVRRGLNKPSAGCTTLAEADLVRLIRWLDPTASPHYVLLPRADYAALRTAWRLP